jgi:hypothetical protein
MVEYGISWAGKEAKEIARGLPGRQSGLGAGHRPSGQRVELRNSVNGLGRSVIGVPCIAKAPRHMAKGRLDMTSGSKNILRLRRNATSPPRIAIDPPRTAKGAPYTATGLLDIAMSSKKIF